MKLKLAIAFVLLNIIDIGLTLYFVRHGISTEINPIMAQILSYSLPIVLAYKVLLPALFMAAILTLSYQLVLRRINWILILILLVAGECLVCLFNLTGILFV